MSDIATGTLQFVREWMDGVQTKRQYQTYYIVKTDHAEFLMNNTAKKMCLGIRDHNGHLFVFPHDDAVEVSDNRIYLHPRDEENPIMANIKKGFTEKPYVTVLARSDFEDMVSKLSTWRTISSMTFKNDWHFPLWTGIVEIAGTQYLIEPRLGDGQHYGAMAWIAYEREKKSQTHNLHKSTIEELPFKIEDIKDVRGRFANGLAPLGAEYNYGWLYVATDFTNSDQIDGLDEKAIRASRPSPFVYGIDPNMLDFGLWATRYETLAFNPEQSMKLIPCMKARGRQTEAANPRNWEVRIKRTYPEELADKLLSFLRDDDAWLQANYVFCRKAAVARVLQELSENFHDAEIVVKVEDNPSAVRGYVGYIRRRNDKRFYKILPTMGIAEAVKKLW